MASAAGVISRKFCDEAGQAAERGMFPSEKCEKCPQGLNRLRKKACSGRNSQNTFLRA
jgi:hypothetical protein